MQGTAPAKMTRRVSRSTVQGGIIDLPYDVLLHLLAFLPVDAIVHLLTTSRALYSLIKDEEIWKEVSRRYGVHDARCFGNHSFFEVYTGLLHTYGCLIGTTWAGDHPFTGGVLQFRLDLEGHVRPRGIIGEIWAFRSLEPEEADAYPPPEPPQLTPAIFITFPDLLPADCRIASAPEPERHAQVFCICLCESAISDEARDIRPLYQKWHGAKMQVGSETTQGTLIHTRRGSSVHPDFPNDPRAAWYDPKRVFPRLKPQVFPIVDATSMLKNYPHLRVPELFATRTEYIKPRALTLRCLAGCAMRGSSLLTYHNHTPCAPRYYPLHTSTPHGIEPTASDWHPRSLVGLWLANYSYHGTECIFIAWDAQSRTLSGTKITGDEHVPRGIVSWMLDVSRSCVIEPEERSTCDRAFRGEASKYRLFRGTGHLSARGYITGEQDTPPIIMAVVGADDMRMLWPEDGDIFHYTRYRDSLADVWRAEQSV